MALGLSPTEIVAKGVYQLLTAAPHWERVFLSEVAHVQNGFAFKSDLFDRDEGVPLIRIRDISNTTTEHRYVGDYDPAYLVRRGDILIGMDGDFTAARWRGEEALLNQRVCRLTVTSEHMDGRFFFLCLQPYLDAINAETSSVTVKHLSSRTVEAIPLPLPPLAEQHRIVAKIEELFSELDKGIENLRTARAQLEIYREAVLKQAFDGRLTADWRDNNRDVLEGSAKHVERAKEARAAKHQEQLDSWKCTVEQWESDGKPGRKQSRPRPPKSLTPLGDEIRRDLPELPDGWAWDRLGWMTCRVEYGTSAKSDDSGRIPVLRMGNIQSGRVDWSDLVFSSDEEEIERYRLRDGDVLFNRTNSPELVGKSAIYRGSREAIFAGYLIRINQIPLAVDPKYLNFYLNSCVARRHGNRVKTDGVNQSNINGTKLMNYPFPYCSLAEQREIVRRLEQKLSIADQLSADLRRTLEQAGGLRQSILKRAFAGQLLDQDSSDEPASVLLERIQAERAAKSNSKKNRKAAS